MQVNLQVSEAGPSKGPRHQASLSQSSTKDLPPTPISPTIHGRPTHVQAIHDFNPLLLASAAGSTSSANMYLPFKAGEIIRVHVRDTTGWWDGEISVVDAEEEARKGPRRGWFPSNYVREMGVDGSSHRRGESNTKSEATTSPKSRNQSISSTHHRHQSSTSHHSRISSTTTTQTLSPRSQAMSELPQSFQAIILPIIHALTSLDNAIHTNKRFHIQPATAAIISSIRSALMMTDCLNKESTVLSAWPTLVKERKIVLIDLSKLVGLARVATGNVNDQANPPSELDVKDLNAIATAARAVFASIQKFLNLAHGCGVRPISSADARQSSDDMGIAATSDGSRRSEVQTHTASRGLAKGRQSSNARMQETFKLRAASIGDLRAARKLASSPPPPVPMTAGMLSSNHTVTGSSSPASVGTPMSASFASSSGSARSSPVVHRPNHARQKTSSVGSSSTHSNGEPSPISQGSFTGRSYNSPAKTAPTSSSDVWEAISVAEDGLLSIIAAFIGHIHSHHISSHPSSHANLIEMTRETIDCVRELLTVVESIGRSPGIRSEKPREIDQLRVSKDNLYEIASKLVEGAESVANAPFSEVGETDYEGVKGRLLQTATATLRCGTECVRLVKLCIPEESTPSATATPRQWDPVGRQLTPRPAHEAALVYRDRLVGQRGVHTLSGLHRKASSLGQLQQRFKEGSTGIQGSMDEDEVQTEDDDEEVVGDTSREEEHTLQPAVQVTKPFPEVKRRPSLLHTHTSPSLLTPGPRSAEMFKSYSEDPGPRSRSSSLTSPAPPSRMTHRSPSRSADLDKFTADYNLPSITRRSPLAQALASPAGTPSEYHPSTAPGSLRSSGGSEHTTPAPTTPHSFDAPLDDSPVLDYLKPEPPVPAPVNRLAKLRIDTGVVGNNQLTAPRPDAPQRSATAPLPVASTDARFWVVAHDYDPREIAFNSEGNMVGASLAVLVEKMTPHDGPVEHTFWTSFFYTFRLHTKPADLVSAMIARYDIQPPTSMAVGDRERAIWIERKVVPVRLRIYNFLKAWLDTYWVAATDDVVLMTLREFASDVVSRTLPAMAPRLLDSIRRKLSGPLTGSTMSDTKSLKRASSTDKLRSAISPPSHGGLPPTPIISKSLNSLLQKNPSSSVFTITDFDTVELARQLTILESKLFCAVTPEDLLQTGKKAIPELKALSTMSNQITGWVADNILNEQDAKKRAALLKFYIKLSDKCLILNNFSTMFAILAGLNSSIVLRLKRTWDALPVKYRLIMDRLQGLIEHTKNHAAYRAKLREVDGPCLPFLGLILTDITFTSDGNADTRPSVLAPEMQLINHDKYVKLGKIAMDFARYQQPFNLHELEAVQTFLRRVLAERGSGSLDALYRKSLLLEPRQGSERVGPALDKPSWLGGRI